MKLEVGSVKSLKSNSIYIAGDKSQVVCVMANETFVLKAYYCAGISTVLPGYTTGHGLCPAK